ncbi:lytic transglycosylase domain-containing protein [Neisseria animalis]|uniref:Lytic transglycosylase domain-containing protein n=1 Tax=Neisseria animalis TaxID=492 RepID=A0A5P3MS81_NEIAN|nr:lytic transglycosylase domain-containing protein [Neisseria animalis]QEY24310.1 lytic transglycosylase domain-containing protein [Neisseria animalis]ROW32287.1 lytic transglycosylase domain-containing protein [Neisseria animalis]VEE06751.1 transglycosylase [Neisseria animalis]
MKFNPTLTVSLTLLAASLLAACSSNNQPAAAPEVQTANRPSDSIPNRHSESEAKILSDFSQYQSALDAAKRGDDMLPQQFLAQAGDSAMAENVRNEWLKNLGARGQWSTFQTEYKKLNAQGRAQEVQCYADLHNGDYSKAAELVKATGRLPAGCTRLVEAAAASGRLNTDDAWRRVRGLLSNSQTTDARNLAAALGNPLDGSVQGTQEYSLLSVIGKNARKSASAASTLSAMESNLTRAQADFAWGVLGHYQAQSQNMATALSYYNRVSDRKQLTDEQLEWYARAALRLQRWGELAGIIQSMPAKLQNNPTWQYWLARSHAALGNGSRAKPLYEKAAASGRNFYALMAMEELGRRVSTQNNVADARRSDVNRMAKDGAINRALVLFKTAQATGNSKMRSQAQAEWRFATRGFSEDNLLTAAQVAYDNQFYDMAINNADRTDHKLNYNLRYLSPFKDTTVRYAAQAGVDPAWVYGLIRQESRFVMGAQSHVGAQGLMQVMPATAREIAGKIGMNSSELYTMDGNIRMGTWYMADARRRLQNNEVMATAGYNAGPSRARRWQANTPLEGAIYAETIPFNETRDYVKKVMTNATYYASLFNEPQTSLKQRMGTVPAR